jgi:hypothetical protein
MSESCHHALLWWLLLRDTVTVDFAIPGVEVIFFSIADHLIFIFIFIIIIFAFRPFVIPINLTSKCLATTLFLHATAQRFKMITFFPPLF